MNIPSIQAQDVKFNIDFVAVTGLSGPSPSYQIRAELISPTFEFKGRKITATQSMPGVIHLRHLTAQLERLGTTEQSIAAHNDAVMRNCFNPTSEHYCFDKAHIEEFFEILLNMFCCRELNGRLMSDELPSEILQALRQAFLEKLETIKDDLVIGNLSEVDTLLAKISGLAN